MEETVEEKKMFRCGVEEQQRDLSLNLSKAQKYYNSEFKKQTSEINSTVAGKKEKENEKKMLTLFQVKLIIKNIQKWKQQNCREE